MGWSSAGVVISSPARGGAPRAPPDSPVVERGASSTLGAARGGLLGATASLRSAGWSAAGAALRAARAGIEAGWARRRASPPRRRRPPHAAEPPPPPPSPPPPSPP